MNPFADIEITPLFSRDGMQSQGKSVRIRDEDGWNEIGVVSPNYLLVDNLKAKGVLDQIAERSNISDWKQRKVFFDGKRFVYAITTDTVTAEVSPGDIVRFGLILYNSYDGTRALSVGSYCEHLICANGMTSETFFARCTFRHHQGNINWDSETERAILSIIPNSQAKLSQFASIMSKLKKRELEMVQMKNLRKLYLKDLNCSTWGKVVDRFLFDEHHTAFGLLDACTAIFWHNEKQSYSDYRNNSYATDALLEYGTRIMS